MWKTVASISVFLVFLAFPAGAAENCANANDQASMNECADKEFKSSDRELNQRYNEIKARLKDDTDTTKRLVAAQRAWVSYRDAECDFSSFGVAGGSIYPMIAAQCRSALTNSRIDDFKNYLSCEEGDLTCPVPPAQ